MCVCGLFFLESTKSTKVQKFKILKKILLENNFIKNKKIIILENIFLEKYKSTKYKILILK
jgi:hypothetical protein